MDTDNVQKIRVSSCVASGQFKDPQDRSKRRVDDKKTAQPILKWPFISEPIDWLNIHH